MEHSSTEPNLLFKLHRWATLKQQDENFTTEAFAHLLEYLLKHAPDSGLELFGVLTGFTKPSWLSSDECEDVVVDTQYRISQKIPDINISGKDFRIFVEVKVGADVDYGQLEKYQDALNGEPELHKRLVLLTKAPAEASKGIKAIRWKDVSEELRQIRKECGSAYGKFLIDQFIGFIDRRKISVQDRRTELSEELDDYLEKEGETFFENRIRDEKIIYREPGLKNLTELIQSIKAAANRLEDWDLKFDTSGEDGWLAWNANKMLYFFQMEIKNPEVVKIQRYLSGGEEGLWEEGKDRGEIKENKWGLFWEFKKDLVKIEPEFFKNLSSDRKVEILEKIFREGMEFADATWGPGR